MGIQKIQNIGAGFPHQANKVLAGKCRLYICKGSLDGVKLPENKAALKALYTGATAVFLPMGDMDNAGSHITWEQQTYDVDFSTLGLGYTVTGTFMGITVTTESLEFMDNLGFDEYTILCVPDGRDDVFFALSGVTITTAGNLDVVENESISKVTYTATRRVNNLTDAIKYKELAA